jgi:hypothetical protein
VATDPTSFIDPFSMAAFEDRLRATVAETAQSFQERFEYE